MAFFGLGYVDIPLKGDQRHQGRMVIPYYTRTGVVALRSSSVGIDDGTRPEPKYLPWMEGDVNRPFNVTALDGSHEEVYICEGELDTVTAWQCGLYAVGIPGVKNWKPLFRLLFRYRKVTILADNDDSAGEGREFASALARKLSGAQIIVMPKGHDVNSYYTEAGEDVFKKYVLGKD